ncbi:hypothetical protein ACLMJK_001186 [Lecanora helva]
MKILRTKTVSNRWRPSTFKSQLVDGLSLDSETDTTNAKATPLPHFRTLLDIPENAGEDTAQESDIHDGSYTDDKGNWIECISEMDITSSVQLKRRWSMADADLDISKTYPRYVKRLMELVYWELDRITDPTVNIIEFASASVLGAAAACKTSSGQTHSNSIAEMITRDYPRLSSRAKRKYALFDALLCRRYAAVVTDNDWALLIVLSYSKTFRRAALSLLPDAWACFAACIKENAVSLEVFAKIRGLDITAQLDCIAWHQSPTAGRHLLDDQSKKPVIKLGSPGSYIVADTMSKVRRPEFEGRFQMDIDHNIYLPESFAQSKKPRDWPTDKIWPSDPTLRAHGEGTCQSCGSKTMCDCDPLSCAVVTHPLVELRDYGSKGRGIRTLQTINKGDYLAEYVGLITPKDKKQDKDKVYAMSVPPFGNDQADDIASISAKTWGNWTRFINHSCKASTYFVGRMIGNRARMLVKAERDIDIFEELTVDYGSGYWNGMVCECGEKCCISSKTR